MRIVPGCPSYTRRANASPPEQTNTQLKFKGITDGIKKEVGKVEDYVLNVSHRLPGRKKNKHNPKELELEKDFQIPEGETKSTNKNCPC